MFHHVPSQSSARLRERSPQFLWNEEGSSSETEVEDRAEKNRKDCRDRAVVTLHIGIKFLFTIMLPSYQVITRM
jgi:hypothetical protein